MAARKRRCKNCRCMFDINPKIPDQLYCKNKECQRARKNAWQRMKMTTDADYRKNQAAACRRWQEKNPGYWKQYRNKNQTYTCNNREQQRQRNRSQTTAQDSDASILTPIAKMDASKPENKFITGTYRLIPVSGVGIAKMDALIVKIDSIPNSYAHNRGLPP